MQELEEKLAGTGPVQVSGRQLAVRKQQLKKSAPWYAKTGVLQIDADQADDMLGLCEFYEVSQLKLLAKNRDEVVRRKSAIKGFKAQCALGFRGKAKIRETAPDGTETVKDVDIEMAGMAKMAGVMQGCSAAKRGGPGPKRRLGADVGKGEEALLDLELDTPDHLDEDGLEYVPESDAEVSAKMAEFFHTEILMEHTMVAVRKRDRGPWKHYENMPQSQAKAMERKNMMELRKKFYNTDFGEVIPKHLREGYIVSFGYKVAAEGDRYGVNRFGAILNRIQEHGSVHFEIEEPGCNTVKLYDAARMTEVKPVWISEIQLTYFVETGERCRFSKGPTVEILSKQYATGGHQRPEVIVKNLVTNAVETHSMMDLVWGRPVKGNDGSWGWTGAWGTPTMIEQPVVDMHVAEPMEGVTYAREDVLLDAEGVSSPDPELDYLPYDAWLKKQPAEMVMRFMRGSVVRLKFLEKHHKRIYDLKIHLYWSRVIHKIENQTSLDREDEYKKELKTVYKKVETTCGKLNAGLNSLNSLIKDVANHPNGRPSGLQDDMIRVQKELKEAMKLLRAVKPSTIVADEMNYEKRTNAA